MKHAIDENLYSRQLYVLGKDAMAAFQKSHVLVVGLTGLGQEIAKNIILAGINKVSLYDPGLVTLRDLSASFYHSHESIGSRRDVSLLQKMKGLNPYVDVDILQSDLEVYSEQFETLLMECEYTLVVLAGADYSRVSRVKNHKLISCRISGLVSQVFCDFKDFVIQDRNGEPCMSGIVNDVTEEGVLTMIDGERHNLCDDAAIKLHRNNEDDYKEFKVVVLSPFKLQLVDYKDGFFLGGSFEELKVPLTVKYKSLGDALNSPVIMNDCDLSRIIHNCYSVMSPSFRDRPDEFVDHYKKALSTLPFKIFSASVCRAFVHMYDIEIMPMASIIGGLVAQEVLKGCSGKFTPLQQFLYFDSLSCLQRKSDCEITTEDNGRFVEVDYGFLADYNKTINSDSLLETRYYAYEKLFGLASYDALQKATGFVVGAGAIGCEHLKNLVMSGVSLKSKLFLTDMDSIEQSNLNRQFLFRQKDIGKMKSTVAIREAKLLNTDYGSQSKNQELLCGFIEKVGPETENIFSDSFYEQLTFVANALDNIDARKYVDGRIILNKKPLFESGTLGTKGNTQVILPNKTESYSSSNDPPEKSIPLCTLRNFPNMIEHTIEFALSEFKNSFTDKIISIKNYLNKEENESIKGENIGEDIEEMVRGIPETLEDSIRCAFDLFYNLFYVQITKLINAFPPDHVTEQGILFWSAPKRPPVAINYDSLNENHTLFVKSAVTLYNNAFGIYGSVGTAAINDYFVKNSVKIHEKAEVRINADSKSMEKPQIIAGSSNDDDRSIETRVFIFKGIPQNITPLEFEKDNDQNSHVDFIYACANIRAQNYKIREANRLQVKGIAGRIIPAIATTTAMISGLSTLEMYKYILGCPTEAYRNTYVNLALPLVANSEPLPPLKDFYYFNTNNKFPFTLWDRIEIDDMTLQEFFTYAREKYDAEVDMVTIGNLTVWLSFGKSKNSNKYLNKKFSEIAEKVEGSKYLHLGVLFNTECETFPFIVVKL